MLTIATLGLGASACVPPPYEADPVSVYQWQRRQDEIQQREADRVRLCATLNKDSARYARDCARPGETN